MAAIPQGTRSWALLLPSHPTPYAAWVMPPSSRLSPTPHPHLPVPNVPGKTELRKR